MRLSPKTLLVTGTVSVLVTTSSIVLSPSIVSSFGSSSATQQPTRVVIEKTHIDLPVQSGKYDTQKNEWQIDDRNAFFAASTKQPGSKYGNTLIYAHNYPHLFAGTLSLLPGDTIKVYTSNRLYTYSVEKSQDVNPKDTGVFSHKGDSRLVLLTCSGPGDITRRLTYAKLQSIESNTQPSLATN